MTSSDDQATEDALDQYLAAGWRIAPLQSIREGRCTCGRPDCPSPGKHPIAALTPDGFKSATTDPATVAMWLDNAPWMNVALPTGQDQGFVVVDVDIDHDGLETMDRLERRYGVLPLTRMVQTGGGGLHLYWSAPTKPLKNSAGRIGRGVDVRADGGYVVAPNSLHISGQRYTWADPDAPILPMPGWLLARCQADPVPLTTTRSFMGRTPASDRYREPVGNGQRNVTLAKVAGAMRRQGLDEGTIADALLSHNARHCSPPLPEREVVQVARSISRYPAGYAQTGAA